jgi:hypothetical protein
MKSLSALRQGFISTGLLLTTGVILLGGGLLAWEWHGAHPSSKGHAAKAVKPPTAEHHHKHKDKDKKHHAESEQ